MRLTERLLGWLPSFFQKTADPFAAFRLRFDGPGIGSVGPFGCTWSIADGVLTATRTEEGQPPVTVTAALSDHTIAGMAQYLAGHGFDVVLQADPAQGLLSALALMDGSGDQATSNGDLVTAYTSLLWAYLEPIARELAIAEDAIVQMLLQLSTKTASGEWLVLLGTFYAVPKFDGETDASYSTRIITEVLRPRGNGIAIAEALKQATGQDVTVTDVTIYGEPVPNYGGTYIHDGSEVHNATSKPVYGLFDVLVGYDLVNGGPLAAFIDQVRSQVARLRDAGTHLRSLLLTGSLLNDTGPMPVSDAVGIIAQTLSIADTGILPDDENLASEAGVDLGADTLPAGNDDGLTFMPAMTLADTGLMPDDASLVSDAGVALGSDTLPAANDDGLALAETLALDDAGPPPDDPTAQDSLVATYGNRALDGTYTLDGTWYLASGTTATVHLDGST